MSEQLYTAPPPSHVRTCGWWTASDTPPISGDEALHRALMQVGLPLYAVEHDGGLAWSADGSALLGDDLPPPNAALPLRAYVPPIRPEALGDAEFRAAHRLRYAYVVGEMANGIASEAMVEAAARAGLLGFFGAAGLDVPRVEAAIDRLQTSVGDLPHGFNLIHSPAEPDLEAAVVDLYLRRGVRLVSASAYLDLTPMLLRYRLTGLRRAPDGSVIAPNRVIAKVSRVEVARKFLSPPPAAMLAALAHQGAITADEAALAARIPVAADLTAEADSGGHTDNRPLVALLPTMIALRDELQERFDYAAPPRIGAAGGIATPASAAAAFAMGAAYVLTGSINQACIEAATSDAVKQMLARAGQADVMMAPAADMFEMGVKVQVLKWGTMFAVRAQKLYDLYRACDCIESIPAAQRTMLERDYFRCSLDESWEQTRRFFERRDPRQLERAEREPKHKMALVFRAYLGQASKWAVRGDPDRKADYQVWCGPAMGAFNEWTRGSCLEDPSRRDVVSVAMNLLVGAAVATRAAWLRAQGVRIPSTAERFRPLPLDELRELLE